MNTFHLVITSPGGTLYDGPAAVLSLRGAEGDLAVMAGHIPFITSVQPCTCKLTLQEGDERAGTTQGGLLSVTNDVVTLISGSFEWQK